MSVDTDLKNLNSLYLWREEYAAEISAISKLSPQERRVVYFVSKGNMNKVIAAILKIATKTVEKHRSSAMRKLKVSSFAELMRVITVAQILGEFPLVESK